MKPTTKALIAVGALATLAGVATVVNAGNDRGEYKRGYDRGAVGEMRYHAMGRGHMGGGGPMRPGMAGGPGFGPGHGMFAMMGPVAMKRFFEEADTDGNGELSMEEIEAARTKTFAKHDADGDGELTLAEYEALFVEMMRPMMVRSFQFLDPNGDAVVTVEEFERPANRLARHLDRNRDGVLSPADRPHGPGRHGMQPRRGPHPHGDRPDHHRDRDEAETEDN